MEKNMTDIIVLCSLVSIILVVVLIYLSKIYLHRILQKEQKINQIRLTQKDALLKNTFQVEEKERKIIAEELHDNLGSTLNLVRLQLFDLYQDKELKPILNRLDHCILLSRNISHNLKSPILKQFGLLPAIKDLSNSFTHTFKVKMNILQDTGSRLDPMQELHLYRIFQEVFHNIVKHAKASQVQIGWHHGKNITGITVDDNGIGFPTGAFNVGAGISNIESRVHILKAQYKYKNLPTSGSRLTLILFKNETN